MSNGLENSDPSPAPDFSNCAICNIAVTIGKSYMVRIDIFADPAWSDSKLTSADGEIKDSLTHLINQIKSMTADELQDGVHRRFEYRLPAMPTQTSCESTGFAAVFSRRR
jgi:hypothetical protein